MIMKTRITFILSLILSLSTYAQEISVDNSIAKNVSLSDSHKTLVKAIKAAGLEEILNGEENFTVFAPTDQAFSNIADGTLNELLKTDNKKELKTILTNHIIQGIIKAEDIVKFVKGNDGKMKVKAINGGKLTISLDQGDVEIKSQNGNIAKVKKANLNSSNGVIHIVDNVLMP